MNISEIQETLDELLKKALESENKKLGVSYRYISDYYRLNAELSLEKEERSVVLNTLSEYPDVQLLIEIDEISENYKRTATRDVSRYLREWSYRYGSKGRPVEKMDNPDTGERVDETDEIVSILNTRVNKSELTVNDVALALKLADTIYEDYENKKDIYQTERYKQVQEILEEVEKSLEKKQPDLDWDKMAGTFDLIREQTQQDIMKELGRKEIISELNEFNGDSIEAFLNEQDS
jgi:hypothetical protein